MIILSFGFKYGLCEANHYNDVTFLSNPARKFGLHNDLTEEMTKFVLNQDDFHVFAEKSVDMIRLLDRLDGGQRIAFGCNSGRHRSVVMAEYTAYVLRNHGVYITDVIHRNGNISFDIIKVFDEFSR